MACPIWRYPLGSGGKRVMGASHLPSAISAAIISRIKSRRSVSGEDMPVMLHSLDLFASVIHWLINDIGVSENDLV